MARRGNYQRPVTIAPDDLTIQGGDIIGSDADGDTKIALIDSRAQLVVDGAVRVDAQPSAVTLDVGVGPGVKLDANGKTVLAVPYRSVGSADSPVTVATTDGIIAVDTTGGPVTLVFPSPATFPTGQFVRVFDLGNAGTNAITVQCVGFNIGGQASPHLIDADREKVEISSTGSEWILS